ncbi:hypothetical protein J8I87_26410 [Paraburkholderia sp. LEh10]|uniref:hypothetical protein n=1 Tax=Paraburkholderia sp. LEh10 TaxID=2821353 RepID=UPI001AE8EC7A|nr:hypothetical protein [Paraburkholderia sp. LEh10]MBP0593184.1 hypothetical protein [Paraburkholderia sp. LEh10]
MEQLDHVGRIAVSPRLDLACVPASDAPDFGEYQLENLGNTGKARRRKPLTY